MCESRDAQPVKDLIQALLLETGRLMEDESAELALALPSEPSLIVTRVDHVHRVATDILALADAARALARNMGGQPKLTSPAE